MKKQFFLILLIFMLMFIITGCGNKNNVDSSNDSTVKTEEDKKVNSDFWLGNANIPSETKTISIGLVDGNDSVPIDLNKIDSSYSFNYTDYPKNGEPIYKKVSSISDVKGNLWDGSVKKVEIKNSDGETINTLNIHSECGDKKYNTYEDAILNNCWLIDINEDKLFGKKFDYKTPDGINEIMENIFDLFGKPTHIYVRDDDELIIKDNKIGSLSSNIIYEFDGFKLKLLLLDTYNKEYDYRMLNYYGLVYVPNGMDDSKNDGLYTKDIINELVK